MSLRLRKACIRLSRMSWDEFRTRLLQEVSKRTDYALFRAGLPRAPGRIGGMPHRTSTFFFSPSQLQARVALIRQLLPSVVSETIQEAEEIMQHRFRLLGYRNLNYGPQIDWHLDVVHGKRAPLEPWYKIAYLDFEEVGDHKVTWELNRHQHFMTLAKAWAYTKENRYAQEIVQQFYSWQSANPYPIGINWGSSLEVAFRSISWLWMRNLLAECPILPSSFDQDMLSALARNGRYIERYLSTYFSPNTHLIGEAMALFFIGTLCPQIHGAEGWQQKGLAILLAEAQRQVRPDGVYFEQSLYYHVYALDFFLHTRVLALCNGISVPESFDRVLEKALEVVRVLSRNGPPLAFGDDDGGRLFNPRRNRAEDMSDPLAVGATLFESEQLRPAALTEEALWLFGESARAITPRESSPALSSVAFKDGGLYVIAGPGEHAGEMLVDAGPHGIGQGGHGHADALSLRISISRHPWLVDPGSYTYIGFGNERNLFRGTAAHSTLRIDQLDQAVPEGPFSWSSLPEVRAEDWVVGRLFTFFSGLHTGYRRLPDPVLHRRMIFHLNGQYWLVRDLVEGEREHELEVFWRFAPDLRIVTSQNGFLASSADRKLVILSEGSADWFSAVEPGFVSACYGEKQDSPVGVSRARIQLPAEHAALLAPMHATGQPGRFYRVNRVQSKGAVAYVYEQGDVIDYMIFGNAGTTWSVGPLQSDATMLFYRCQPREIASLAFCSASFLERDGRRVFSSPSAVERLEWTRTGGPSASDPESLKFFDSNPLRSRTPVT